MKKHVFTFGSLAGLISCIWLIIFTISGACQNDLTGSEVLGYSAMIVAFSMIFIGTKSYRDKVNGGYITFGKAFRLGSLMTLVAATMYVIVWAIDYNFFATDFMEKYSAMMIDELKKSGKPATEINSEIENMKMMAGWYKNPVLFVLITYSEIIPTGLLITLISSLILKRKPKADVVAG